MTKAKNNLGNNPWQVWQENTNKIDHISNTNKNLKESLDKSTHSYSMINDQDLKYIWYSEDFTDPGQFEVDNDGEVITLSTYVFSGFWDAKEKIWDTDKDIDAYWISIDYRNQNYVQVNFEATYSEDLICQGSWDLLKEYAKKYHFVNRVVSDEYRGSKNYTSINDWDDVTKLVEEEKDDMLNKQYRPDIGIGNNWSKVLTLDQATKLFEELGITVERPTPKKQSTWLESAEKIQNWYLNSGYIDSLIKENDLTEKSIEQLTAIKSLLEKHNTKISKNRLTIKNNFVCIDGCELPTGVTHQYYEDITKNPGSLTYPNHAQALLKFTANLIWTEFTFPNNRDQLKEEIDGEVFKKEINTPNNKAIIATLYSILWFNSLIAVWPEKSGGLLCVSVRLDKFEFISMKNGFMDWYYYVPAA